jgi:hypothetical protein
MVLSPLLADPVEAAPGRKGLASVKPVGKLVVIIANRLLLSDFIDPGSKLRNISRIISEGAVGLISPNSERPRTESAVLMTASAGYRCPGGDFVREFYDSNEVLPTTGERAAAAFRLRTSHAAPDGSALFLGIGPALRVLRERGIPARFGAVGDLVHRAGLRCCAIGNADVDPIDRNRAIAILAVDSEGIIDVGRLKVSSGNFECVLSGNVSTLADSVMECLQKADLVIVNFGESTVLDDLKLHFSELAYEAHKRAVMQRLDSLVARIIAAQREGLCSGMMLASFSVPKNGYWNHLTPIIIWVPQTRARLLTSPTTRTAGLVAASDFPNLIEHLLLRRHLSPGEIMCDGDLAEVRRLDARVYSNHTLVLPIAWVFASIAALSMTAGSIVAGFRLRVSQPVRSVISYGLLVSIAAPLGMLLAVLGPPSIVPYAGLMVGVPILIAILVRSGFRRAAAAIIFGLTALVIILDAVTGCKLGKFSPPSSFQLEGFRYYGIGNEYAAVLICCSATLVIFAQYRLRVNLALILGLVVTSVLGIGKLGSNYGAAASAAITFGLMMVAISIGRYRARHVFLAFVAGISIAVGLAWTDWALFGPMSSHGGRIIGDGVAALISLSTRKALMNLRLAVSEQALNAYLVFALFIGLWFWRVQPSVCELLGSDARLKTGLKAFLIGVAAALLLNDSGVVMAAIMLGMLAAFLLYVVLEQGYNAENCGS